MLFNEKVNTEMTPISISTAKIKIPVPTHKETVKAIKKQKSNKAAGSDGIPAECIKYGGETLHRAIHKLIQNIWNTEMIPEPWKEGVIVTIHKKENKKNA